MYTSPPFDPAQLSIKVQLCMMIVFVSRTVIDPPRRALLFRKIQRNMIAFDDSEKEIAPTFPFLVVELPLKEHSSIKIE